MAQKPLNVERWGMNATFDEEWTLRAACAKRSPDELFVQGAAQRQAREVCFDCPVRLECLVDALDNRIQYGVWGGMTERERRALLRRAPAVESWRSTLDGVDRDEITEEIGRRWPAPRPRRRTEAAAPGTAPSQAPAAPASDRAGAPVPDAPPARVPDAPAAVARGA